MFVPTKTKFNLNIYNMKKSKKQFKEDLVAWSIAGIVATYIVACMVSIISNL
jgi:hypothetical protein